VVTNSGHEGNYTIGNRSPTTKLAGMGQKLPCWARASSICCLPLRPPRGPWETYGFSGGRSAGFGPGRGAPGTAPRRRTPSGWRHSHGLRRPRTHGRGHPGPTTTPPRLKSACGTSWARPSTAPSYKLLGGTKDKVMAYASSQHLPNVEDYIATCSAPRSRAM